MQEVHNALPERNDFFNQIFILNLIISDQFLSLCNNIVLETSFELFQGSWTLLKQTEH